MGTRGQVSHSQASRCTREFPGGLRRTRSLPGKVSTRGALGDRWHAPKVGPNGVSKMARSEGGFRAGFRDKCRTPKGSEGGVPKSFRLAFGTRGLLRKVPKEVPAKASKGAFGGHSAGLR